MWVVCEEFLVTLCFYNTNMSLILLFSIQCQVCSVNVTGTASHGLTSCWCAVPASGVELLSSNWLTRQMLASSLHRMVFRCGGRWRFRAL